MTRHHRSDEPNWPGARRRRVAGSRRRFAPERRLRFETLERRDLLSVTLLYEFTETASGAVVTDGSALPGTPFGSAGLKDGSSANLQGQFLTYNNLPGPVATQALEGSPGDFNRDAIVDGGDFLAWQRGVGQVGNAADGNGYVNDADLRLWRRDFGTLDAESSGFAVRSNSIPTDSLVHQSILLPGLHGSDAVEDRTSLASAAAWFEYISSRDRDMVFNDYKIANSADRSALLTDASWAARASYPSLVSSIDGAMTDWTRDHRLSLDSHVAAFARLRVALSNALWRTVRTDQSSLTALSETWHSFLSKY